MKRLLYILLDGVGDRPNPELNYTTPLEAALTPNLDALARQGVKGLVYPVGKGVSPESDIAVFSMLGYDVHTEYPGRGVIEAVGLDLEFKSGDLAVRANFATID
ncbi:MAG: phosphoglycerate mutase, partial [Nitrososphaerales archaeon]